MSKVTMFSCKDYFKTGIIERSEAYSLGLELNFVMNNLNASTAHFANESFAVCIFVNDKVDARALEILYEGGTRLICCMCAGYNMIDIGKANELGIKVCRVPAYSPYAVAEFAVGLLLTLNRKIHRAYNRTREGNFEVTGLNGFDLHGKTVAVIGTGKIGSIFCRIMNGFGCRILAYDIIQNPEIQSFVEYTDLSNCFS